MRTTVLQSWTVQSAGVAALHTNKIQTKQIPGINLAYSPFLSPFPSPAAAPSLAAVDAPVSGPTAPGPCLDNLVDWLPIGQLKC